MNFELELQVIHFAEVIAKRAEIAKKKLRQAMLEGHEVPGWRLGRSIGNRRWVDPEKILDFLVGQGYIEDELYEKKLLSPAMIEKFELSKGRTRKAWKEALAQFTKRPDLGIVAVPENSSLPHVEIGEEFDPIGEI